MPTLPPAGPRTAAPISNARQRIARLVIALGVVGIGIAARTAMVAIAPEEPRYATAQADPGRIFLPVAVRDRSIPDAPRTTWDHAYTAAMNDVAWDASRGWVWAGGKGGLWAWDTVTGKSLHFRQADGMAADAVTSLAVAPNGEVWVGHGSADDRSPVAGASRRGVDGAWSVIASEQGLPNPIVVSTAIAPDGRVWLGTTNGLARREADGRWTRLYDPAFGIGGLPGDLITAIAFDAAGNAWLGAKTVLIRVAIDGTWRRYYQADHSGPFAALAVDLDGHAWIARDFMGLTRVAPDAPEHGGSGRQWLRPEEGLPDASAMITAVDIDPEGRLWVGWNAGIGVRHADGGWSTWTMRRQDGSGSLPAAGIRALDASGAAPVAAAWGMALWRGGAPDAVDEWNAFEPAVRLGGSQAVIGIVPLPDGRIAAAIDPAYGGPGGLAVRDDAGGWSLHRLTDTTPEGDAAYGFGPRALVPTDPNGAVWNGDLWIAGRSGLYLWHNDLDRLDPSPMPPAKDCYYPSDLAAPSNGVLWMSCSFGDSNRRASLWRRGPPSSDEWTDVAPPDGRHVRDLAVGPGAAVWAAAGDAAYRLTADGWRREATAPDATARTVERIAFDRTGHAWMTDGYDSVFTLLPNGTPRSIAGLPKGRVRSMAPDPDGGVWIGTDNAFAHIDPNGIVTTGNVPPPHPGYSYWNQVCALAVGRRGDLWIGTPNGIARWR